MRKVIYTIHGERGAIRVEDDDVEVAVMNGERPTDGTCMWEMKKQTHRVRMDGREPRRLVPLAASTQFAEAIAPNDFVEPRDRGERSLRRAHHERLRVGAATAVA